MEMRRAEVPAVSHWSVPLEAARRRSSKPSWFERARRLMLSPREEWSAIKGEFTTARPIYLRYLAPMAAIGPAAATLGTIISGGERSSLAGTYTISTMDAITRGVLEYALNLTAMYLFAIAIAILAASLGGQRNQVQALKVAAYGSTPYWLAGALSILPKLTPIGMLLSLYSARLFASGLVTVTDVPREKSALATLLTMVGGVVFVLLISAILQLVVG